MGFFADELSLAENDDDFLPHFNADAIVLVRDGKIRAGAVTTLINLPERTIAAGTYTLDELYDYRPDGDEPFALYSRIEIDDAIEIVPGGELEGPARFVASNRISIGPNASILSRLAGGSSQAATSPELLGTEIGAMGFFADELSLAENDDDFLPHFNADAIVLRGSVVDIERPYLSRCTNFSQLYPPLSPSPVSDCDFDRSIRFDVGRLCVQNDPDGVSSGVDACDGSPAVIELADSMRGLSVGPRLRVADGRHIVTGDTLSSFAVLLEGAGVYSISNDNSDGGQVISELSVGSAPGRYLPGEPRPDVGDFVDEVVVDAIDLSEGKNIVCAWPADGTDRLVRADVPEMGTCIEIIFLP